MKAEPQLLRETFAPVAEDAPVFPALMWQRSPVEFVTSVLMYEVLIVTEGWKFEPEPGIILGAINPVAEVLPPRHPPVVTGEAIQPLSQ